MRIEHHTKGMKMEIMWTIILLGTLLHGTQSNSTEPTPSSKPIETTTQFIPTQTTTQSKPTEITTTQSNPTETTTQSNPTETTTQSKPTQTTTQSEPSGITTTQFKSTETTTTESKLTQTTTQSNPTETTSQSKPTETTTQSKPTETTTQSKPTETTTTQSEPTQTTTTQSKLTGTTTTQSEPNETTPQSNPSKTTIQSKPTSTTTQTSPSDFATQRHTTSSVGAKPFNPTPTNSTISPSQQTDPRQDEKIKEIKKDLNETCNMILQKKQGNCSVEKKGKTFILTVTVDDLQDHTNKTPTNTEQKENKKDEAIPDTLIAILASCGALVLILCCFAAYCTYHRRSYRKNQQHLTEELQTVENGYHDNPTLEVMEVQPEMQEKKPALNGEFNDSWIVPIDNLLKEDMQDEEDTHL